MIGIAARFCENEDGATSIEYALIASLICMVIIAGITGVGEQLTSVFERVSEAYDSVQ